MSDFQVEENRWTSSKRDDWIRLCKTEVKKCQSHLKYKYYILHKEEKEEKEEKDDITKNQEPTEDDTCSFSDEVAKVIYSDPRFMKISIGYYHLLCERLEKHSFIGKYISSKNVIIAIKGGTAYAIIAKNKGDFPNSDLDITIYINPELDINLFNNIKKCIEQIVAQTLSLHKKNIDNAFFLTHKTNNINFLDNVSIEEFKAKYTRKMNEIGIPSIFDNKTSKFVSSKNSFIIENHENLLNASVRIEIPHFPDCEKLPLMMTPVFCSKNNTLQFMDNNLKRSFCLFRMKLNNNYREYDDNVQVRLNINNDDHIKVNIKPRYGFKQISADLIDVSIPNHDDDDMIDTWKHGNFLNVFDNVFSRSLTIPTIHSCIRDIQKMLNLYTSSEFKRNKRILKMQKLLNYLE